ncbi:glyoxylase I 4-like [Impatiens glandulifera]|uniref:glyoxylase I 4-like n=1 Tax=Impatiens glandulifera TaxID=253017 RepID=UPI001FB18A68|nr:glyoxylase I 4-like [Impatiens glandulifera]
MEIQEVGKYETLPLLSLNHVSLLVRSVWDSVRFYEDVLGFCLIKRPSSFKFNGAWLYNYGIGIHFIENEALDEFDTIMEPRPINPKDNHISFQSSDVEVVKRKLEEMGMRYVTALVVEDGIEVDQVFFHDPDGYMIEICNCDKIPVLPISSCPLKTNMGINMGDVYGNNVYNTSNNKFNNKYIKNIKCGVMEAVMMKLSMDMMNFSF